MRVIAERIGVGAYLASLSLAGRYSEDQIDSAVAECVMGFGSWETANRRNELATAFGDKDPDSTLSDPFRKRIMGEN
jgi:hypothetical protein